MNDIDPAPPADPQRRLALLVPRPHSASTPAGCWTAEIGSPEAPPLVVEVTVEPASSPPAPQATPVTPNRALGGSGGEGSDPAADRRIVDTAIARVGAALGRYGIGIVEVSAEAESRAATTAHAAETSSPEAPSIRLRVSPQALRGSVELSVEASSPPPPAESYRLSVGPGGVDLRAADAAGLLHGTATLAQWIAIAGSTVRRDGGRGSALTVPALEVHDRPDFRHRGVLLDVSRDKVPTLDTLRSLVRWLSGFKVNQLQLYMEHTFAYRGHETVWRDASPLTPEDIREIDALCRAHAIELVPCQNSFGHLHRWLTHDEYRPLAECPQGVRHPWAHPETGGPEGDLEPFSLCATDPAVLDLLADLYAQLLPNFSSRQLNAGLDESFDLGRCRSREACEERGRHRVYLDYLGSIHRLAAEHGKDLQFWGDVLLEAPELAAEVPADAVALVWGHEPGHPFAEHGATLAAAGVDFYVCPGTSAWTSLSGRLDVALANAAAAAVAGRATGAIGYLQTDWGDFGHLQPLPVSFPGLLAGAAAAWNADRPLAMEEVADVVALHGFGNRGHGSDSHTGARLGRALTGLGTVHRVAGGDNTNGTALFYLLLKPDRAMNSTRFAGLTRESLTAARARIGESVAELEGLGRSGYEPSDDRKPDATGDAGSGHGASEQEAPAKTSLGDLDTATRELRWVSDILDLACRLGLARLAAGEESGDPAAPLTAVAAPIRADLAGELEHLFAERRRLWLTRNRPGGLDHALGWFAPLAERLRSAPTGPRSD